MMKMELLREGIWNGIKITREIMDQMVANFEHFKDILRVPLKLGHNKQQPLTDGMPALGELSKIWIDENGTMIGEATGMPDIVSKAIKGKLYRDVSIEASFDVTHKGTDYGAVLTGLALLGADLPAVNTLSDLQAYLSKENGFAFSRSISFSMQEDKNMNEEELRSQLAELNAQFATFKAEKATSDAQKDAEMAKLTQENADLLQAQKTVKFTAEKKELEDSMEDLVTGEVITPAQRDAFAAQIKDDATLASVKMSVDVLSTGKPDKGKKKGAEGMVDNKDDLDLKGKNPDEVIHAKTLQLKAKNNCSYQEANDVVMLENPGLAREYADMTGS